MIAYQSLVKEKAPTVCRWPVPKPDPADTVKGLTYGEVPVSDAGERPISATGRADCYLLPQGRLFC